MSSWHEGKQFLEHLLNINHDTLHLIVGTLVWLVLAIVLKRGIFSPLPWAWVLALASWNETVDLWNEQWPTPGTQYGEAAKDLFLTVCVPTILTVAVRIRPDLLRQASPRKDLGKHD
jgi:hypothetical protein